MKLKKIKLLLAFVPTLVLASCSFNTNVGAQDPSQQEEPSKQPTKEVENKPVDSANPDTNLTPVDTDKEESSKQPPKQDENKHVDSTNPDSNLTRIDANKEEESTKIIQQPELEHSDNLGNKNEQPSKENEGLIHENSQTDISDKNTSQTITVQVQKPDLVKDINKNPTKKKVFDEPFSKVSLDEISKNIRFPKEYQKINANYESGFIERENDKAFLGNQNDNLFVYDLKKAADKNKIFSDSYTDEQKQNYFDLSKKIRNDYYSIYHTQENKIWKDVDKIAFNSLENDDKRFEDIFERNLRISVGTSTILDTKDGKALLVTNQHVTRPMKLQDIDSKHSHFNIRNKENLRFYNYILNDFFKIYYKNKVYSFSNDTFLSWQWQKYKYYKFLNSDANTFINKGTYSSAQIDSLSRQSFSEEEILDFQINFFNKYFQIVKNFDNKRQDIALYYFNFKEYIKDWKEIIEWVSAIWDTEDTSDIDERNYANIHNQKKNIQERDFFDVGWPFFSNFRPKQNKITKNVYLDSSKTSFIGADNYYFVIPKYKMTFEQLKEYKKSVKKEKEKIAQEKEKLKIFKEYWDHISSLKPVKISDKIWKENDFDDTLKISAFWPKNTIFKNVFKGIKVNAVPIYGKDEGDLNSFYFVNNGHGASGSGIFNRDGSLAFINSFGFLFEGKDPVTRKPVSNTFYLDSNLNTFLSGGVVLRTNRYNLVDEIYKFYLNKPEEKN